MAPAFSHRVVTSAEGFPHFTDEPLETQREQVRVQGSFHPRGLTDWAENTCAASDGAASRQASLPAGQHPHTRAEAAPDPRPQGRHTPTQDSSKGGKAGISIDKDLEMQEDT